MVPQDHYVNITVLDAEGKNLPFGGIEWRTVIPKKIALLYQTCMVTEVDLAALFEFEEPGTYKVSARYFSDILKTFQSPITMASNSISLQLVKSSEDSSEKMKPPISVRDKCCTQNTTRIVEREKMFIPS